MSGGSSLRPQAVCSRRIALFFFRSETMRMPEVSKFSLGGGGVVFLALYLFLTLV